MSAADAGQAIADQVLSEREDACHCGGGGLPCPHCRPALPPATTIFRGHWSAAGQIDINRDIARRATLSPAQIDNDRDSVGGSGIPEVTFRPLSFIEHRTFAKRSHVKDRKGFDMTYFGSTRVVDQASAHSLPRTVAGRPQP